MTVYFEDIQIGDSAEYAKTITEADILMFAAVSGDDNPLHMQARALLSAVEKLGYVVIDHVELNSHYADLREESEGRGAHRNAADKAINYLFEVLGEPGAGE